MRIVLILLALALVAVLFNQHWLARGIFMFITGCALWGLGETAWDIWKAVRRWTSLN